MNRREFIKLVASAVVGLFVKPKTEQVTENVITMDDIEWYKPTWSNWEIPVKFCGLRHLITTGHLDCDTKITLEYGNCEPPVVRFEKDEK